MGRGERMRKRMCRGGRGRGDEEERCWKTIQVKNEGGWYRNERKERRANRLKQYEKLRWREKLWGDEENLFVRRRHWRMIRNYKKKMKKKINMSCVSGCRASVTWLKLFFTLMHWYFDDIDILIKKKRYIDTVTHLYILQRHIWWIQCQLYDIGRKWEIVIRLCVS